jgi:hypothetical protein
MTRTTVNRSIDRSGVLTGLITDSIFSDLFVSGFRAATNA